MPLAGSSGFKGSGSQGGQVLDIVQIGLTLEIHVPSINTTFHSSKFLGNIKSHDRQTGIK